MPAGSLEKLKYAYAYGADAVYLGVPYYSLRARENEFDLESLVEARRISTELGKKIYVTANVFAKNRKIKNFEKYLSQWESIKPDAFIMSDPGLMMIAREKFPDINIHLSVQANCMNWKSIKFWHESLGVSRVILSRELHIDEIREIKQRVPDIELEAFVHGAICIAYSGRCLMSSYMSYRDANQGVCDNSCREKFKLHSADKSNVSEDYFLEDMRSKGSLYQISEDENGTYLMNAKDLRLVQHLKEISEAGVCSFKVEGRTKSLNYVSLVSKIYRQAIDDMWDGKEFNNELMKDLEKVANRGYDSGFMIRENPSHESQNYETSISRNFQQQYGGLVRSPKSKVIKDLISKTEKEIPRGYLPIEVRNKITKGQKCEILLPNKDIYSFKVTEILNKDLQPVESAHGGAGVCFFKVDDQLDEHMDYGILSLFKTNFEYYAKEPPIA